MGTPPNNTCLVVEQGIPWMARFNKLIVSMRGSGVVCKGFGRLVHAGDCHVELGEVHFLKGIIAEDSTLCSVSLSCS